jgi:DNA-binding transcriptional ArsR family regulator
LRSFDALEASRALETLYRQGPDSPDERRGRGWDARDSVVRLERALRQDPRRQAVQAPGWQHRHRVGHRPAQADRVAHAGTDRIRIAVARLAQPTISKLLPVLHESGFVDIERRAQRRVYSLRAEPIIRLDDWLDPLRTAWTERLDALERHLDSGARDD